MLIGEGVVRGVIGSDNPIAQHFAHAVLREAHRVADLGLRPVEGLPIGARWGGVGRWCQVLDGLDCVGCQVLDVLTDLLMAHAGLLCDLTQAHALVAQPLVDVRAEQT